MNTDLQAGMAHFLSWSVFAGFGAMFVVVGGLVFAGGIQVARRQETEEEAIERVAAAIPTSPLVAPSGAAE